MTDFFQTKTRDDGSVFICLVDDRPEWVYEAVREAHDDEFPDDWRYEHCALIFEQVAQGANDPDDADTIADSLVDIYDADIVKWLADNTTRSAYVDDWHNDYGAEFNDVISSIRGGQYVCLERMARVIIEAWNENHDSD